MNYSKNQQSILDFLESHSILTAHEICEKLPKINRATIYRNLQKLVDLGVIRELSVQKAVTSYEKVIPNNTHQHLICKNCHQVEPIEIDTKKLEKLLPKNISISEIELNLKGQCSHCKHA